MSAAPGPAGGPWYLWHWRSRLPERKGRRCRVLVRGSRNSVLVEFEDGERVVTSRYALRRAFDVAPTPGTGDEIEPG